MSKRKLDSSKSQTDDKPAKKRLIDENKENKPSPEAKKLAEFHELVELHFKCPITLERPWVPVALPCQHIFDFGPLAEHYSKRSADQLKTCPVCGEWIRTDDVERLPVALSIYDFLQAISPETYTKEKVAAARKPLRASNLTSLGVRPVIPAASAPATRPLTAEALARRVAERKEENRKLQAQLADWAAAFTKDFLLPTVNKVIEREAKDKYSIQVYIPPAMYSTLNSAKRAAIKTYWTSKFNTIYDPFFSDSSSTINVEC